MTTDDRISRHLADQAGTISLSPADPAEIKRRGARRRHRRRGALVGTAAALAVLATSVAVVDRGDPDEDVVLGSGDLAVAPSTFDWTVVEPRAGLGYDRSVVELSSGAVYGLSTAPGTDGSGTDDLEPALYRSDDGAEWEQIALPDGVKVASLAASGDQLYAIGTAPAADGIRVVVATNEADGGWRRAELPQEVADLQARFPGQIQVTHPVVAARDVDEVVAAVVVSANPDVEALVPGAADSSAGWELTPDGVTLLELPCDEPGSGCTAPDAEALAAGMSSATMPPTTTVVGPDGAVTSDTMRRAGDPERTAPQPGASYTWDELGVDPELQAHIGGRTYVYSSHDGGPFEPVALPAERRGFGSNLLRTDDGYRLFVASHADGSSTTDVLHSTDGRTWAQSASLPGSPAAVGLLGGRAAVGLYGSDAVGMVVRVEHPDRSWSTVDLAGGLTDPGAEAVAIHDVAFGPLGLMALAATGDGEARDAHLLHSTDGSSLSDLPLADVIDDDEYPSGLDVTADALLVRLANPGDGDRDTPPTQRVLVGTPTG
jgi:hypothetical protein